MGIKTVYSHLAQVRLEQLGEGHLRSKGPRLHPGGGPAPEQQCEVAGERQPVAVQDLHACVGRADHVEIGDAPAQVPIEPGADLAVQPIDVEVGRGVSEVDDDVGQLVNVPGPDGEQQVLKLRLARACQAADVANARVGRPYVVRLPGLQSSFFDRAQFTFAVWASPSRQ